MSDYEAKGYYRTKSNALGYDQQYEEPLRPSNLRARFVGWRESAAFLRLLQHAPSSGSVLDIACGTGRYTRLLLDKGYRVGGLDASPEMLSISKERSSDYSNLLFLKGGDAESLPFEENQFDGVTCMRLFHRVPPEPRLRMLREVKRVGRGWAILFFGMTTRWLVVRRSIRSRVLGGRASNPYPVSPSQLQRDLDSLGFHVQDRRWVIPQVADGMMMFVTW